VRSGRRESVIDSPLPIAGLEAAAKQLEGSLLLFQIGDAPLGRLVEQVDPDQRPARGILADVAARGVGAPLGDIFALEGQVFLQLLHPARDAVALADGLDLPVDGGDPLSDVVHVVAVEARLLADLGRAVAVEDRKVTEAAQRLLDADLELERVTGADDAPGLDEQGAVVGVGLGKGVESRQIGVDELRVALVQCLAQRRLVGQRGAALAL
jgi:hypothetical protein